MPKAEAYAQQAEVIFRQFVNLVELARVWDNLGVVYLHQGNWSDAWLHLEKSLKTWRNLGNKMGEIEVLMDIVDYELAQENQQLAATRLKEVEQAMGLNKDNVQYRHLQPRLAEYRRSLTEQLLQQAATT